MLTKSQKKKILKDIIKFFRDNWGVHFPVNLSGSYEAIEDDFNKEKIKAETEIKKLFPDFNFNNILDNWEQQKENLSKAYNQKLKQLSTETWGLDAKDIWYLLMEEEKLKTQGTSLKEQNEGWELEEQQKEIESYNEICEKLGKANTLSEALDIFKRFEGLGQFKDYYLKPWTKNGQARIYISRKSKEKGFFLINPDGKIITNNCLDCFDLTNIKLKSLTNDIKAKTKITDPYELAEKNLNARYGKGGWDQFDYEDELEREEYQF